jgi:Leucine-rich repeat (LRR) protein
MANLELTYLDTKTKADGIRPLHEVLNTDFEIIRQMLNQQDARLAEMEVIVPPPEYEITITPPE